ncbi:SRPBCC family protein [Actinophytocola sp.]|uniref:SRPBCC family protein n=1 Tax=Actinophytocola sp. TaxID=1872138 RepID=UPI002D7E9DF0|nr:SRPBCC family protein [Actinophytocola sp.]HET9144190.1 SRPBCC family protein [Actinophytocola sp.]
MPTITNTIEIKADAQDVWAVLADLPATRRWLPGVVTARVDGDLRVCTMADGQEIHERITALSPHDRTLRFEHVRVSLPVQHSAGSFTVAAAPAAGTATVRLETTFEPLDPAGLDELITMIHGAFQQSLESLRRFVEDKTTWDTATLT